MFACVKEPDRYDVRCTIVPYFTNTTTVNIVRYLVCACADLIIVSSVPEIDGSLTAANFVKTSY